MHKLVLIRHGESTWNLENRFTGWTDVDLTTTGIEQAKNSGRLLKAEGYEFDLAYTSVLKRATRTLWHCLDEMDRTWLPVQHSWRLNERHYGALQGLNKAETAKQYGDEQVLVWRRSYDTPPPALEASDPRCERGDRLPAEARHLARRRQHEIQLLRRRQGRLRGHGRFLNQRDHRRGTCCRQFGRLPRRSSRLGQAHAAQPFNRARRNSRRSCRSRRRQPRRRLFRQPLRK